jgi:3-oxoacyl-(acyl-carrier-protein) synthase
MECEMSLVEREASHKGRFHPYAISRWRGNSVGAAVTLRFGLGGCDFSLNAASGTGAQVVNLAGTLVRHGLAEVVMVVAADPAPPAGLMRAMESNRSVSVEGCARPLGAGRAGMNPSEGAACVVLESERHAATRGAQPLAEWLGGETANESYHLLAPEPGAAVLSELLQRALAEYPAPDWLSLHATGTPRFDAVEVGCLQRVFGGDLPWVSAMKRTTGHALGASGVIEAVLLMEGLRLGRVPSWPANTDPALGLTCPRLAPKPRTAFQIGQGMGGSVVVNVFAALA